MNDPIGITVTGGPSGIAANSQDIARVAGVLSFALVGITLAHSQCTKISAMARELYGQSQTTAVLLQDPSAPILVSQTISAAQSLETRTARLRDRLTDLKDEVLAAAHQYESAEAGLVSTVAGAGIGLTSYCVPGAAFYVALGTGMRPGGGSLKERFVAGGAVLLGSLNPFRNPFRAPDVGDASGALNRGSSIFTFFTGGRADRELRPGHLTERTKQMAPVATLNDAAQAIKDLPSETIMIQRHAQPNGTETWSVFIKGTEGGSAGNVFGMDQNFALMAGESSAGTDLVEAAMQQAGIPQGGNVGFYGYSQGGIVAMTLANNTAVRARYNVTNVTTFGSPVASKVLDDPIPTLHIDNNKETVSDLDGAPPVDTAGKTTITGALPADYPGRPHSLDTHLEVLETAQHLGDPGVDQAIAQQTANLAHSGGLPLSTTERLNLFPTEEPGVETLFFSPGQESPTFRGLLPDQSAASQLPCVVPDDFPRISPTTQFTAPLLEPPLLAPPRLPGGAGLTELPWLRPNGPGADAQLGPLPGGPGPLGTLPPVVASPTTWTGGQH